MATRFGAEGMRVVLADVDGPEVEAAAAELAAGGVSAVGVPTDVSSAEAVDALAKRAVAEFGAVHVVCNNAGVGGTGGLAWDLPFSAWYRSARACLASFDSLKGAELGETLLTFFPSGSTGASASSG